MRWHGALRRAARRAAARSKRVRRRIDGAKEVRRSEARVAFIRGEAAGSGALREVRG